MDGRQLRRGALCEHGSGAPTPVGLGGPKLTQAPSPGSPFATGAMYLRPFPRGPGLLEEFPHRPLRESVRIPKKVIFFFSLVCFFAPTQPSTRRAA